MWQVLLGIYLVVGGLSAILLWSSLVVAKKSDRNTESRLQRVTGASTGDQGDFILNQILELPSLSQLIKK
jgi:hypothetical protein